MKMYTIYHGFKIKIWAYYGTWWYSVDGVTFNTLKDAQDYIERNYLK